MDTVKIFDTTLRDGEQSPGATLTLPEKVEIAKLLDAMGVDIIEAGFPIASDGDFASVKAIAEQVSRATICGLARSTAKDIDRAGESIKPAKSGRIHVFLATSKIHREHKLRKGKEEILKLAVQSIKQAKGYTQDVEFSPEDASRTELEFLEEICIAAAEAGATTINLPDTTGYAVPETYGAMFAHIAKLPIIRERNVILSTHCHDDLGMAVANSLAGVIGGARQVECTINGIGERAGNASLEEFVMNLQVRNDFYKLRTNIDATKLYQASRTVSTLTGLAVPRNKAIIGRNAFAHESGIHQDGMLKHRETYEIMDPASVGVPKNELVLGKHSGRAAFKDRVTQMGQALSDEQIENVFTQFKALADKKKEVYDEDIEALIDAEFGRANATWELVSMQVMAATSALPTATVVLKDTEGRIVQDASIGDGPVDAVFSAIARITGVSGNLSDFRIQAVTTGKEAMAEAQISIDHADGSVRGRGNSTDTFEACALAYMTVVNRVLSKATRKRDVHQHTGV